MLDNSKLIAPFCPENKDGDTFIYTELLDRGKKKGNNGHRLLKTFYHRSIDEFWEQWEVIKPVCDLIKIRACTRLAPKSYRKVGQVFTRMVLEAEITDNHAGMKSLYNRACGVTPPNEKMWLFDIDVINDATIEFETFLKENGNHIATIPSKKGLHYISRPFDTRNFEGFKKQKSLTDEHLSLHKDNPTNLYIPDGAD